MKCLSLEYVVKVPQITFLQIETIIVQTQKHGELACLLYKRCGTRKGYVFLQSCIGLSSLVLLGFGYLAVAGGRKG